MLPMLVAILFLTAIIGVAMGVTAVLQTLQAGQRVFTEQARVAADAGVRDALLRLVRDRDYFALNPETYELPFIGYCAAVTVTPLDADNNTIITADGRSRGIVRRVEVLAHVPEDGNIIVRSWKEVTSGVPAQCSPLAETASPTTAHPLREWTAIAGFPGFFCEADSSNYSFGYRFTPLQNGNITKLGGYWSGGPARTIRLYSEGGACLGKTSVSSSLTWQYSDVTDCTTGAPIAPIAVNAGSSYIVGVYVLAFTQFCYADLSTGPDVDYGGTTINESRWGYNEVMPENIDEALMYGLADVEYQY